MPYFVHYSSDASTKKLVPSFRVFLLGFEFCNCYFLLKFPTDLTVSHNITEDLLTWFALLPFAKSSMKYFCQSPSFYCRIVKDSRPSRVINRGLLIARSPFALVHIVSLDKGLRELHSTSYLLPLTIPDKWGQILLQNVMYKYMKMSDSSVILFTFPAQNQCSYPCCDL